MLDAVLPQLLQQAAPASGHISLVASVAGYRGLPKALAYGPTKAALINLAETLYLDLQPQGIGVSRDQPGLRRDAADRAERVHDAGADHAGAGGRGDRERLGARASSRSTSRSASRRWLKVLRPAAVRRLLPGGAQVHRPMTLRCRWSGSLVFFETPARRRALATPGRVLRRRRVLQGPVQRGARRRRRSSASSRTCSRRWTSRASSSASVVRGRRSAS